MTWADWRFYRKHSRLHWWQWLWRHLTWPGARFHCSHSPMPQLSRERREDGSKIWYCEDCGMLYKVTDHCYRPTNRQIGGIRYERQTNRAALTATIQRLRLRPRA